MTSRHVEESHQPKITAEEFERAYAAQSKLTVEELRAAGRVVVACRPACDDPDCEGWISQAADI